MKKKQFLNKIEADSHFMERNGKGWKSGRVILIMSSELTVENYRTLNRLMREEMETVSRELARHHTQDGLDYYNYLVGLREKLKRKVRTR